MTTPNLAELFPADPDYWGDQEIILVWEAVLLSLGIEPRTIRDLAEQRNPDDEEDRICYGQQEQEYHRRIAAVRNAIAAATLILFQTHDPRYKDYLRLAEFVVWARDKAWSLPDWLESKAAPNISDVKPHTLSNIRESKKAKTQKQYAEWQSKADALKKSHPSWPTSEIARSIAADLAKSEKPPSISTIRNNIKI
jgi:hypothetical protein